MAMVDIIENRTPLGFPYWSPVLRNFSPDSPFFASGNIERELLAKQVALDINEDEKQQLQSMEDEENRYRIRFNLPFSGLIDLAKLEFWGDQPQAIVVHYWILQLRCFSLKMEVFCPIVGCGARLNSLDVFEDHYNARHTASCSVCSRVYPTSRLLSIHVSEAHDSFFQAKVARGFAMYECLVDGCGVKLKSYKSRQLHLVDKHKFPTSFEFFKKAHTSKKQRQKNQRRQSAHKRDEEASCAMQVEQETIDGLVSAVSKLSTSDASPSSISFGHRHTRGFTFVPRVVQRERRPDSSPA